MVNSSYDTYLVQLATEITKYLIKNGCPKEDAEDILQEVLIKFLILEVNLPKEKIRAWMYQVAKNDFYNLVKRKKNYQLILTTYFQPNQLWYELELQQDDLLNLLLKLDEKNAQLLLLKYVQELSVKEIALSLGKIPTVVKTELYRARKKLKKILKEEGNFNGRFKS